MSIVKTTGPVINSYKDYEVEIMEIGEKDQIILQDGTEVKIPYIDFKDGKAKNYIIIRKITPPEDENDKTKTEKYRNYEIYSIDFVYGNIDFERLNNNPEYKSRFLKYIVSRDGLDNIVKKTCGALPIDVSIPQKQEGDWFKDLSNFRFDMETVKAVVEGVLKSSHRKKVKLEKEEEPENVQTPKGVWNTLNAIEGGNAPKKKKKSVWQVFAEVDNENAEKRRKKEEKKDRDRRRSMGEKVIEPLDYAEETDFNDVKLEDALVAFYKTGGVIIQKPIYDITGIRTGDYESITVVTRYNLCYKDVGDNRPTEIQTILMSDVDEEKLGLNGEYRDKFISDICLPILKYSKYGLPLEINQKWPYLGGFDISEDFSMKKVIRDDNDDLQKFFSLLSNTPDKMKKDIR